MPQFFFPTDYDGSRYADDTGEVLESSQEAEAYSGKIANELGRYGLKMVVVSEVDEQGAVLSEVSSNRTEGNTPWPHWNLRKEQRE
jgi:hypothetical protein